MCVSHSVESADLNGFEYALYNSIRKGAITAPLSDAPYGSAYVLKFAFDALKCFGYVIHHLGQFTQLNSDVFIVHVYTPHT